MTRGAWLLSLAVALGLLAPASGDDPKPDAKKKVVTDILAKLKEKQERGWNERYKLEFERATGPEQWDFQIDWKTGMFRFEGTTTAEYPYEGVEIYDGKQLKTHFRLLNADKTPKGEWTYGLNTGVMRDRIFVGRFWPIFFARGVLKASSKDAFYPGHFTFEAPDSAFFVHKQAAGSVTLRTYPETPTRQSFFEYTFDLGKDCAVTEYRFWMDGEVSTHLAVEYKQQDRRWAPSAWTLTYNPNRPRKDVTKARVTSFAADVPVTADNAYDIIPPEGARVGRSDYQPTDKPGIRKIDFYEYVVKDGELVQTAGPVSSAWMSLGNWRWGIAVTAFLGAVALCFRRLRLHRKV